MASVGNNLGKRNVGWGKSDISLASGKQSARNLTNIVGYPKSVEDIWSGLGLVGTNHGAGAGNAAAGRDY